MKFLIIEDFFLKVIYKIQINFEYIIKEVLGFILIKFYMLYDY